MILVCKGFAQKDAAGPAGGTTSVALAVVTTLYGVVYVAMKTGPCMNPAVGVAFTVLEMW